MRNEQMELLDIVFEHRNKEYGAYALRKGYATTMTRSLLGALGLVITAAVLLSMRDRAVVQQHPPIKDSVRLVDLGPTPPPPTEKPLPPTPPTDVHTQKDVTFQVVKDILVEPKEMPPPIDSLIDAAIGTQTVQGADPVSNTTAPSTPPSNPTPTPEMRETPYNANEVDEPAEFPGGLAALGRFLTQRLQDPRDGSEAADGTVRVQVVFVVGNDGELGGYRMANGPAGEAGAQFSDEVIRVLKKMPRWKPARQHGRPVAMYFALPVTFDRKAE